ncbi:MAG: antitoxin VapB family protein [Thermoproteota archaeon]
MGYKTISLSDEAYEKLASLKREGESFTDVILRLCSKSPKKPLASFAGSWVMSEEEEKKIFREVSELWSKYEESLLGH